MKASEADERRISREEAVVHVTSRFFPIAK